jgi:hypothetical protein
MIINGNDILSDVMNLSRKGYTKGHQMPFKCLSELYTRKLGHTTYSVGHEYSGKTEFELEIDVWLAKKYKLKTAIFTPETGTVEDIYLEIAHKWCGKSLIGDYVSENDKMKILAEVNQYFFIIDTPDEAASLQEIFDALHIFEHENNIFIQNIVIDPFNELKFDLHGMPRDIWLEKELGNARKLARKDKRHITIVTHPIESDRLYHKDGYLLAPSRKQYAGGQAWARKGEAMLSVWRPPSNGEKFKDTDGLPYGENEAHIEIQKSKPKGVGKTGVAKLEFDWKRSAYFEWYAGKKYYAGELEAYLNENPKIKEYEDFPDPLKTNDYEPF